MNLAVFDVESYPNYFLLALKLVGEPKRKLFDTQTSFNSKQSRVISRMLSEHALIGFNSCNYDALMVSAALQGWSAEQLNKLSHQIITSRDPAWKIKKSNMLADMPCYEHIDLFASLPYSVPISLKIAATRMGYKTIVDLPYSPDETLDDDQIKKIRSYCVNDLGVTEELYARVKDTVDMKKEMSTTLSKGPEWWNMGDSKIAERVMKMRLNVKGKVEHNLAKEEVLDLPEWLTFQGCGHEELIGLEDKVRGSKMTLNEKGKSMPTGDFSAYAIQIGDTKYKLGIGGLHSKDKNTSVYASDEYNVCDLDVASYYPNLIKALNIAPAHLGSKFSEVYKAVTAQRLKAKKNGEKSLDASLKIVINSVYGKLSNKYSCVYSPYDAVRVTVTGQLALLMLIQSFEVAGIKVVSANTDGIVCIYPKRDARAFDSIKQLWMDQTGFELEQTDYRSVHFRDVNNYLAIRPDGSTKRKGIFAEQSLSKGLYPSCITRSVVNHIKHGTPIVRNIYDTWDPNDFCHARKVNGGGVFKDQYLGRVVRWAWRDNAPEADVIKYKTNGNNVPQSTGSIPMMDLSTQFKPDYERYVEAANSIIEEITQNEIRN